MVETIFSNPLFKDIVLPFLLVFTIVFAILEKTKLLGDGKKQIDAIVALVVGLIFVGFSTATSIVSRLVPFLAVALIILFIVMLVFGFVGGKEKDVLGRGVKIALGVVFGIAFVIAILFVTGYLDKLINMVTVNANAGKILVNVVFLVAVGAAIALILASGKKGGSSE